MRGFKDVHKCEASCSVEYVGLGRKPKPWCERFESKILYVGDCWIWDQAALKTDAQRNRLNFRTNEYDNIDACRWIYENVIGPIPYGHQIDHAVCEDWRCVNPFHLEAVTPLENQRRYRDTRKSWTLRDGQGKFVGRREGA